MTKQTTKAVEYTASKHGKLRDPKATFKLSLKLASAKADRKAAIRKANLIAAANKLLDRVSVSVDGLVNKAKELQTKAQANGFSSVL